MIKIYQNHKAKVVSNEGSHGFQIDEIVEFLEAFETEDGEYWYRFKNGKGVKQYLLEDEFELMSR